ncbi:hypothetical protein [uncultured Gammaproteobacteria bacterium]|nr:hypothetical protein [uncultured Gammaproteobacteria bacterium]CAC9610952.1 hypothetical protein [uncultured Gammaproteobacteria bacterium]CAC9615194.1 hypothetical protein [uncultured Gammaproteobacteria bacterium]CAC9617405.1 hypothetical protein [uncultured Gammaproteobacteria bacterium]CAC9623275.1 hypothetical protein [uncultured Gammaproteobacteria bacterium]
MIFKCTLEYEIEVDEENIYEKYPNYGINYDSSKDFANRLVPDGDVYEVDTNISKHGLEEWGYSIKVKRLKSQFIP